MDIDALTGFIEGRNHKVPYIIGTNANETNYMYGDDSITGGFPVMTALGMTPALSAYWPPTSKANYENIIRKVYKDSVNEIFSLYPADQVCSHRNTRARLIFQ